MKKERNMFQMKEEDKISVGGGWWWGDRKVMKQIIDLIKSSK